MPVNQSRENKVRVILHGLKKDHYFYSMDITGFPKEHKAFLEKNLQTIHEYSWMVNLDDSENENGYHVRTVRGDPRVIDKVIEKMQKKFKYKATSPLFTPIDPDEGKSWKTKTTRQLFQETFGDMTV